jgi:hypothetical protein
MGGIFKAQVHENVNRYYKIFPPESEFKNQTIPPHKTRVFSKEPRDPAPNK